MRQTTKRDGLIAGSIIAAVCWMGMASSIACLFNRPRDFIDLRPKETNQRRMIRRIEIMLLVWWTILLGAYFVQPYRIPIIWIVLIVLVTLRILNIVTYGLRVMFVPSAFLRSRRLVEVYSIRRSLVLSMANFVEMTVGFGSIYAAFSNDLSMSSKASYDGWTYLYYSCITQLTIGFGDILPKEGLRIVSSLQGLLGLLMISIIVSKFVNMIGLQETTYKRRRGG